MAKETLEAKHAVKLELGGGRIGQAITGTIVEAWIETEGGEPITEVPVGTGFDVAIRYNVSNPGFPYSWSDPYWSLSFTAMSTDGEVHASEWANMIKAQVIGAVDRIEGMHMPDHDITLRVKMWGHQAFNQHYPPVNQW